MNIVCGVVNGTVLRWIARNVLIIVVLGCIIVVSAMEMLPIVVLLQAVIDLGLRVMMRLLVVRTVALML